MSITEYIRSSYSDIPEPIRQWADRTHRVRPADVEIACIESQDWRDEWIDRAPWPSYTLQVSVCGTIIGTIQGWHFLDPSGVTEGVGSIGSPEDSDGAFSGLPTLYDAYGYIHGTHTCPDPPSIEGGDNIGGSLDLPERDTDGAWLIYDAQEIIDAIESAAGNADHGEDPTLEDATDQPRRYQGEDSHGHQTVYVSTDYLLREVQIERYVGYRTSDEDDEEIRETQYLVVAYAIEDDPAISEDERYESVRDAMDALREQYGIHCVYRDHDVACAHLREMMTDRLTEMEPLAHLTCGQNDDGVLYVSTEDYEAPYEPRFADDHAYEGRGEIYHLDEDDAAAVCMQGWIAVLAQVRAAFGTRQVLAASHEWQQQMDEIIAARDPFVSLDDSLAAGNCRAMSVRFRDQIEATLEATGAIGAVRASVVLALRDDAYTRRAARQAASRYVEAS